MARIPWSARRAGTPETGETHVVVLITQRSRVQIPPPLPRCRSEALSEPGRGLLHVVVHGARGETHVVTVVDVGHRRDIYRT